MTTCSEESCSKRIMEGVLPCVCCQRHHCLGHITPESHGCGNMRAELERRRFAETKAKQKAEEREPARQKLLSKLEEKRQARAPQQVQQKSGKKAPTATPGQQKRH
eukprot:PhM_4_TR18225/c0_g1_i1/m.86850